MRLSLEALYGNPKYDARSELRTWAVVLALVAAIAIADWKIAEPISLGILYLLPVVVAARSPKRWYMASLCLICSVLREYLGRVHGMPEALFRMSIAFVGFECAGFVVQELHRARRIAFQHLWEKQREIDLRHDVERELHAIVETTPLAILTANADGELLQWNASAQRLLALTDTPEKTSDDNAAHIDRYVPVLSNLRLAHSGLRLRTNIQTLARRSDGETFLANVWISSYPSDSGTRMAAVIWDITEDFRDREDTGLHSLMQTSRILMGAVTHEIRNFAAAATTSYERAATIGSLRDSPDFQRLGAVISTLHSIAKSGLGATREASVGTIDLENALEEAKIILEPTLRDAGIEMQWHIDPGLPLVRFEQHALLQVLLNMARNSQRALSGCSVQRVSISAVKAGEHVEVRFADSGPGVADPEILFSAFADGAQTGLGLYVSRAVLRSYGGDLVYETQRRGGATFLLKLRIANMSWTSGATLQDGDTDSV